MAERKKSKPRSPNLGGKRPGAGRPRKHRPDYDSEFKSRVIESVHRAAEKHGHDFIEAAIEMIYDKKCLATARSSVFKTLSDIFAVQRIEMTGKNGGPMETQITGQVSIDLAGARAAFFGKKPETQNESSG